ncbi:MAG: polysaccharide lyase [Armatimonadota bacterium]
MRNTLAIVLTALLIAGTSAFALQEGEPFSSGDRDNLLWEDSFESGGWRAAKGGVISECGNTDGPIWHQAQMQGEYSGQVADEPARAGDHSMRFEWRRENSGESNTSKKAHLWAPMAPEPRVERWWGFSMYIPADGGQADSKGEILVQWHGVPDFDLGEGYRNPIMTVGQREGNLVTSFKYDDREVTPDGFRDWDYTTTQLGPTPYDRWIDFVFHVRWAPTGGGFVEVWMDGEKVVDEHDVKVGFNDEFGPYTGFGIYKWPGASDHERRVIYFDEIRKGNENATFEDVAPGEPGDRRLPVE